jgi:hypothetical protein
MDRFDQAILRLDQRTQGAAQPCGFVFGLKCLLQVDYFN